MKKQILLLLALLFATGVSAQNPTLYFMEGSTFRSQLNPAFAPQRGYVNIPVAGNIQLSTAGNLSLDRILYPSNGKLVTLLDPSISAEQALSGLQQENTLGADVRLGIIGIGAYTKNQKSFWSVDVNMRINGDTNLPYGLFEFLKLGTSNDIRNVNLAASGYLEVAGSYSFPLLKDKLYIGVRGKFLVGMARAQLNYKQLNVQLGEDAWRVKADGEMNLAGGGIEVEPQLNDAGEEVFLFDDIKFNSVKPAGYGFAVDLGATYDVLPNLQVSLAVTDLGFISWSKKEMITGRSVEELEFTGVTVENGQTLPQPEVEFGAFEFTPSTPTSTTTSLRASINAGAEYKIWQERVGFGLLYTARFWESKAQHNLTASVNFQPIKWFTLAGSYSFIDNRAGAVGLALNFHPSWINLFIATDILTTQHTPQWVPIKQSVMNVTFGLGVPIGKKGER